MDRTFKIEQKTYNLDWGIFPLIEFISSGAVDIGKKYKSCIDIGSGAGVQTEILRHAGLEVFQLDKYSASAEYQVDFVDHKFDQQFDVVFCSHVIEHQRNVGIFLDKIFDTVYKDPNSEIIVDLINQKVTILKSNISESFIINSYKKENMLNGYDDIDYLMNLKNTIKKFSEKTPL